MFLLLKMCRASSICMNQFPARMFSPSIPMATEIEEQSHPNRLLIQKHFKISSEKTDRMFEKFKKLEIVSPVTLANSLNLLKSLKLERAEIRQFPDLLLCNASRLDNHYMRLRECGYHHITAHRLKNHDKIMSQSVHFNKSYNFLPPLTNVFESIALSARINLDEAEPFAYNERLPMREVHLAAAKIFLMQRLKISYSEVTRMFYRLPALKDRSIKSIGQNIDLFEHELKLPIDQIIQTNLLNAWSLTTEKVVKMRKLGGVDLQTFILAEPQVLTVEFDNIRDIDEIIAKYRISPNAVVYCKKIFRMHPETLRENLELIQRLSVEPHDVFQRHAILKLARNLNMIQRYLETYNCDADRNQIELDKFIEFYLGRSTNTGLTALADLLKQSENQVKTALANVANSRLVSYYDALTSVELLLSEGFQSDVIFENVRIILYPRSKIKDNLLRIEEFFAKGSTDPLTLALRRKEIVTLTELGIDSDNLTQTQVLQLCIYFMEKEVNFTGDGIQLQKTANEYLDDDLVAMSEILASIRNRMK